MRKEEEKVHIAVQKKFYPNFKINQVIQSKSPQPCQHRLRVQKISQQNRK